MKQSIIPGCTDYGNKNLNDLEENLNDWLNYSKKEKKEFDQKIEKFNSGSNCEWVKVPKNFKIWCNKISKTMGTFIYDLQNIISSIKKKNITDKNINLIKKIGEVSKEYSKDYKKAFDEDRSWKKFGDSNFIEIENLYCDGFNFLTTFHDATNLAARLENYKGQKNDKWFWSFLVPFIVAVSASILVDIVRRFLKLFFGF